MTAPVSVGRMQPLRHLDGPPIEKKVGETNDEHRAWLDAQPVRTGCGLCEWAFEGTAAEGRAVAREHRETSHPRHKDASRTATGTGALTPERDAQEPPAGATAEAAPISPLPGEELAGLERAQAADPPAATAPAAFQAGQLTHELTALAQALRAVVTAAVVLDRIDACEHVRNPGGGA